MLQKMWSFEGPHTVTVQYKDWKPQHLRLEPFTFKNPYLDSTFDVIKFAISFYAATWIPTIIAWVNDYLLERNTPDVHVEIPVVSTRTINLFAAQKLRRNLLSLSSPLRPLGHPGLLRIPRYNLTCRIQACYLPGMAFTTRVLGILLHTTPRQV